MCAECVKPLCIPAVIERVTADQTFEGCFFALLTRFLNHLPRLWFFVGPRRRPSGAHQLCGSGSDWPFTNGVNQLVAGIVTLLCGSLLRRHCWRVLGIHFTGNVKAASDQPVIEAGAYRWVRHPAYAGGMLMYIGTGLALTNWLSVLIITVAGALGYIYRVHVEERALLANLGARYEQYMRDAQSGLCPLCSSRGVETGFCRSRIA